VFARCKLGEAVPTGIVSYLSRKINAAATAARMIEGKGESRDEPRSGRR